MLDCDTCTESDPGPRWEPGLSLSPLSGPVTWFPSAPVDDPQTWLFEPPPEGKLDDFGPMFLPDEVSILDDVEVTGERLDFAAFVLLSTDYVPSWWGDQGSGGGGGDSGVGPHVYTDLNRVGDTSCDADEAWQGLLRNAAPGQDSPASTGNIVNVPGLGPVIQTVNWETMTVTNTTMPGHLLHPGAVSRQVISIGGDIYIETFGWGTGTMGAANTYFADSLWTAMDLLIAIYVDQNDDGEGDC